MRRGTIYTETTVHAAPERFTADAPYQVAIVNVEDGTRITARIQGASVVIGDAVVELDAVAEIPYFGKL
jgi:uncharacterized OB-fold protein